MESDYPPEEFLQLSGLQHFQFCRRQWALIHIENQWSENILTIDGKILHNRVDDPFFSESRAGVIIARSMPVSSRRLGLAGTCDLVEFIPAPDGITLYGLNGFFSPIPIEYKRGTPKLDDCDNVQLCAQAICLEEMLSTTIPKGYFFYGETRRRHELIFTEELRSKVKTITKEMHKYFSSGYTPKVKASKVCKACSLSDICLPVLQEKTQSAKKYIELQIDSD